MADVHAAAASSASGQTPAVQAVLAALDALYKDPDNRAKAEANTWLQAFQKTPEAWQTANELLLSQSLPVEPRLFAAQTFRVKSTYDVDQIPRSTLPSLRATLLTALQAYKQGPRAIRTQISLALAGLALQLKDGEDPEWGDNVVAYMIEQMGSDASQVTTLLEFLTVLPEEITTNQRIPIDSEHYNARCSRLLQRPSLDVLRLLSMYAQAQGVTDEIQSSVFACLASWLKAGEISMQALLPTPLFSMSFDALANEQLFDVAVDVVCDMIRETQEVDENQEAIQLIVSRLLPLRPDLQRAISDGDDDKVRGLCRVFVQAGEAYHRLMLPHRESFFPIVEAIFECARYTDLEIVQITFQFWYFLASGVARNRQDVNGQAFLPVFQQLLEAIVKHLRFPTDMEAWSGQERDDFKSFRHYMGDTLKDCCHVLGSQICLSRSLLMIQEVLGKTDASTTQWQDVEAPLFSMRAMGAEADPHDDEVLPRIIDLIPTLPSHPRLNYASLLVISRYTEWIKYHPDRIPMILSLLSAGYNAGDSDVAAAASQAFKYLGQDCDRELVPFLPQLFAFYQAVIDRVEPDDGRSIAEAIGYVIAAMPVEQATAPLMQFTQPLLQGVSEVAAADAASVGKPELQRAADRMEQIERLVAIVGGQMQPGSLPATCATACQESYQIINTILAKHGSVFFITERACELLRRGLAFFDELAVPVIPALLDRLSSNFEQTGYPSYVWIVGKCVHNLGGVAVLEPSMRAAFERISGKVFAMLQDKAPADMPDVLDDYVHTCTEVATSQPAMLLSSPIFAHAFRVAVSVLQSVYQESILSASLEFVRAVVGHDALGGGAANGDQHAASIRAVLQEQGGALMHALLYGMVTTFGPDSLPTVAVNVRLLAANVGAAPTQAWLGEALALIGDNIVSTQEKQQCLHAVQTSLANGQLDGIKPALQRLYGASRKSRERDRMERQSSLLGAA